MEYLVTIGDYSKQVLQHMYELQKKGIVCDAGLECKDGMVYVHKLILMASDSTYLQSQVTLDGSKNAKRCYVDLNEFSLKTVYDLVKTLYTGEIRVLHENLMELYELCTFLHMEKLQSELQKLVDNDINSGQTSKNKDKTTNQNEEVGRNVPIFEARIVQSDSEHPINIQVIKVEPNQEEFSIVDSTCDIHDDSHHGNMDHNNESLKLDKTPIVKGKTLKRTGSTKVLSKSSKKRKVSSQSRGESSDDENLDDLPVSDMGNVSELLNIAKQLSDDGTRGIVKCDHCQKVLTSEYGDLQRGVCQDCLILYSKDVQEPKTEKKKAKDLSVNEDQCSNPSQGASAMILGAGTEAEMRELLKNAKGKKSVSVSGRSSSPQLPTTGTNHQQDINMTAHQIPATSANTPTSSQQNLSYTTFKSANSTEPVSNGLSSTHATLQEPDDLNNMEPMNTEPQHMSSSTSFFSPALQSFSELLAAENDFDYPVSPPVAALPSSLQTSSQQQDKNHNHLMKKITHLEQYLIEYKQLLCMALQKLNPVHPTPGNLTPNEHTSATTAKPSKQPVKCISVQSTTFSDIPEPYRIPTKTLNRMKTSSHSTGHFATKIVKFLFPELFGPDNQRRFTSYNGLDRVDIKKTALDPVRKGYLEEYLLHIHPELEDPKMYQSEVIDRINEMLRRKPRESTDNTSTDT